MDLRWRGRTTDRDGRVGGVDAVVENVAQSGIYDGDGGVCACVIGRGMKRAKDKSK